MKIRLLSALATLLALALLASCSLIVGSGSPVEKNFTNTDFTDVTVSSAFHCVITQGESYSVLVQVDQSVADKVEVIQTGTTLSVGFRPMTRFAGSIIESRVTITMPAINALGLSGASQGTVSGFSAAAKNLTLTVEGASGLEWTGGDLTNLTANISGASECQLSNLVATKATANVSGASSLRGAPGTVTIGTLSLDVSGASTAILDVSESVSGSVSGASTFRYGLAPGLSGLEISSASSSGPR